MSTQLPNIILVTVDSLRADHLGCYGYAKSTSPNLDHFAKESILFTHAFSNGPNTPHAFPAIMASRNSLMSSKLGLFDAPLTLAEVLKSAGYATLGFNAANPYVSRFFHYDRGFDEFHDFLDFSVDFSRPTSERGSAISVPELDLNRYLISEEAIQAKAWIAGQINRDCFAEIERNAAQPFFLWIHYMDTHYPYLPQMPAQRDLGIAPISKEENLKLNARVRENMDLSATSLSRVVQLYDAALRQLDARIGELLHFLKKRDLYDSSLIVLTADHGEEFMEHGDLQHKSKLYDELLRVPLAIKPPHWHQPDVCQKTVSLLQLASTILSTVKIESPFGADDILQENVKPQVFAAASYCHNHATPVDRNLLNIDALPKVYSLRENHWKLIMDSGNDQNRLFNLIEDPQERQNVCKNKNGQTSKMAEKLQSHIASLERDRLKSRIAAVRKEFGAVQKGYKTRTSTGLS